MHIALLTLLLLSACASQRPGLASGESAIPDPAAAEQLAVHAGRLLESDPIKAEEMLQDAVRLDPACGVAYNNLGVIAMKGPSNSAIPDLFAAAEYFQAAARLMPGRPDPRMNLGLVMERAGRLDDALAAYASAVDASPNHFPSLQALTSLEFRLDRTTTRTIDRLKAISLQSPDSAWRVWAKDKLLRHVGSPAVPGN
ncbi:MAG: tetratricopeptide repeat protein [Hyphomicrobiaceae bacterium]|nr:tetratricopeptide repeat protein [Hyphomicrobiaceae bacterium]